VAGHGWHWISYISREAMAETGSGPHPPCLLWSSWAGKPIFVELADLPIVSACFYLPGCQEMGPRLALPKGRGTHVPRSLLWVKPVVRTDSGI
jgi:hypothetical protein